MEEKVRKEEFKVNGDELLGFVKKLIHEGNIRRITIKDKDGNTLLEIPLTVGVAVSILIPVWVAIGAIAALATNYIIVIEKIEGDGKNL
ncbi:MAG TPA: DUF4342 domain-containing protein [Caldisericia bacterium]|nr:DUF4342 domain-containing protein [Caldisericia bacterium]HQL67489.1 DUF4342 domain-containing protein [Caldisericia bacterium]HQN49119.1 DUF4342 domain-containing protein [Caldisericia bacterium]HQP00370.1 DUF4342 domain-containing protein [Caldisericia bacterium]